MSTRPSERAGHTGRIWRRAGSVTDAADRTRRVVEGGRDRGYEAAPGKVKRTEQPRPKLPLTRLCSQRLLRTLRWLAQFLSVLTGGASSHFKELGEVLTLIAGPKHVAHFDVEVPFGKGSLWKRFPLGKAALATRSVSSGTGRMGSGCIDMSLFSGRLDCRAYI